MGHACYNECMNKLTPLYRPLKVTKVGNSAAVVIPKEVLAKLRVDIGDSIFLTETPDGMRLTAHDPEFERKMTVAERIMREDRDILHVLAQ